MFIKPAYLYFLAIKILLTKILREIFFKTTVYNNSLKTEIPKQLHFYPNPLLLSSFVDHKNLAFKISNINAEIFNENETNIEEIKKLNSFYWLNLINRKNNDKVVQKIIRIWITRNKKYKKIIWGTSNTSKRILSWILNADIILSNTDKNFKENFFSSIIIQINHLKKNLIFENNLSKRVEIISTIILSGLVFKEYNNNFEVGIKYLKKLVDESFDNDGFTLNRNIYDLVQCSKFLVLIKECCSDAQAYIPDYLDNIVTSSIECINAIKTPTDKNPLFNGASEFKVDNYYEYLTSLKYSQKYPKNKVGNIYIIKNKKAFIFFDVGSPPEKRISNNYQCGPLSFEYFFENKKIITNCGYGNKISKKAELISRLTSAQSTLSLNETSVVKFERNNLLNKAFGNSIKFLFKVYDFDYEDNLKFFSVYAKHNAYENNFYYTHKRLIRLSKKNGNLLGRDELVSTKRIDSSNTYCIRFHLYPGINGVKTIGGKKILIHIEKNKSLTFSTDGDKLSLEKSVFLGRNKILSNFCINISGTLLNNEDKSINWELKENN